MEVAIAWCLGLIVGVAAGIVFSVDIPQDTINRFEKSPICIEQKVGIEVVRNCYTLTKVTK
jgi:hypothetical protein